jgi:TolA-binding protein
MSEDTRKKHSLTCLILILTILVCFFLWQKSNFTKLDEEINTQVERANKTSQTMTNLYNETFSQNQQLKQQIKDSEQTIEKLKFEINNLKQEK